MMKKTYNLSFDRLRTLRRRTLSEVEVQLTTYSLLFFLVSGFWFSRMKLLLQKRFGIPTSIFVVILFSGLVSLSYAKEITILYTGETHAALYHCNCPIEPDGGIARRAALIKQLRSSNPDLLLLDSGGFFAGGLMDENTQNSELDMQRTLINLKAIEAMKYDALAVGDDEFNFGKEFLGAHAAKSTSAFVSSNVQSDALKPFLIKEVAGTKIGIIGVTGLSAMSKAGGLTFIAPKIAVRDALDQLKKQGAHIIVLLSHLGESDDLALLQEVKDIDILIVGHSRQNEKESSSKVDATLILRPTWQGRRMGKLTLTLTDNKIADYKVEDIRLSDKISDDPGIMSFLPRCFSEAQCKKEGFSGNCLNPGTPKAECAFNKLPSVNLTIVTPKVCATCKTEEVIAFLKKTVPGVSESYLYYPSAKAAQLIKDFGIEGLPAYFLGKEIEQTQGFAQLKENLASKGNLYMLKPESAGISFLVNREKIPGKVDLFISLYEKDCGILLEVIRDFNPIVHFLAAKEQDKFGAAKGNLEVEEYLRAVCIHKHYPDDFWDYITCRAKNIDSSWWQDCAGNLDSDKIKICAQSQEGKGLLLENIRLNGEVKVMFGPTYLLDNQEVFGTKGVPTKEALKEIIKK